MRRSKTAEIRTPSVALLVQTRCNMFVDVNSSQWAGRSSHPTLSLTDISQHCFLSNCSWGGWMRKSTILRDGCLMWNVGVFLFFSFMEIRLFCSYPAFPSSERAVLQCSWCKSPAQTTPACQKSAADSFNPSPQSSYPGLHHRRALAVASKHTASWSHTSRLTWEARACTSFHLALRECSFEKGEKKVFFSVKPRFIRSFSFFHFWAETRTSLLASPFNYFPHAHFKP